jgi:hypothetical protein
MKDDLKLSGEVTLVLKDSNGNVKQTKTIKNLVVTAGLNFITSRMQNASKGIMSHMGLGSGTVAAAAGDTDLGSLLGSREAIDTDLVSGNTVTYVCTFEAGDATGAITEAGIFNAVSGGDMLCRTVFSAVNKAASDSLAITWVVTLSV